MKNEPTHPVSMVVTPLSIGGATETVVALSYGLKEKEYDVDIVTGPPLESEGDMLGPAYQIGMNVIIIPTMVSNIHPIKDLITFFSLVSLIQGKVLIKLFIRTVRRQVC